MHKERVAQVLLKPSKVLLRYEKAIVPNKLNHKPQAQTRVWEGKKNQKKMTVH